MGKKTFEIKKDITEGKLDDIFLKLYVDETKISSEKERYIKAIEDFERIFGEKEINIFSAPGRSEIGGNHTDHQRGKVLTASVNIDMIACVCPNDTNIIRLNSDGYGQIDVDISDLDINPRESESTAALVRGVAAGCAKRGYRIGGFDAHITSEVLSGSGVSSSAAIEILLAEIFSGLFNDDKIDSITKAKIGQEAENQYFGKPSGLLDQMGCSVGGMVYIDFEDAENPKVERVNTDFEAFGHSLCIVDTKGSHADLTDEYARITKELKKICEYFGKSVLREVNEEDFYSDLSMVRKYAGDRAVLRAIHVFDDNKRVDDQCKALSNNDFALFKELIRESGNSSYRYLQNVYSSKKPEEQSISIALVMTKKILGKDCACRVQGGGFAGTIEVFVPNEEVERYREKIERIFGKGSCYVLRIRSVGGMKVI